MTDRQLLMGLLTKVEKAIWAAYQVERIWIEDYLEDLGVECERIREEIHHND